MNWLIDSILNEMIVIRYFEDISMSIHVKRQSVCCAMKREDWSVKRLPLEPLDLVR